jgi:hypothetical protein
MEPSIERIDGASILPAPTNPMTAVFEAMAAPVGSARARSLRALKDGGEVGLGLAGV